MAATIADQIALVGQYTDSTVRLRQALLRAVDGIWAGLGAYRDDDAARFVATVAPIVTGSVGAMSTMTDAYLTTLLGMMLAAPVKAGAARGDYPREGVTVAQVYRRPLVTVWTALANGVPFGQAVEQGRGRLASIAATDLQLAKRAAAHARLSADTRVVGYRRVLVGSHSCALCALAASQRYHRIKKMAVHPGCNCAVAPIIGTEDPGQTIDTHAVKDPAALEAGDIHTLDTVDPLHAAIRERFGGQWDAGGRSLDYRDLVVEHTHGELGPVLARKGDRFTGPDDL